MSNHRSPAELSLLSLLIRWSLYGLCFRAETIFFGLSDNVAAQHICPLRD